MKNTIYGYGPDLSNKGPDDIVEIKIGMYHNDSKNTNQRFETYKRSHMDATKLFEFDTDLTDGDVHEHLRSTLYRFLNFKLGEGGREMFRFKVKRFNDIKSAIARFLNGDRYGNDKSNSYYMRPEQQSCVDQTVAYFNRYDGIGVNEFLWDCKMRFGKTFTAYELIAAMNNDLPIRNVIILTMRPSDVKAAWLSETDHVDFDFNFVDMSEQTTAPILDQEKINVVFCSYQQKPEVGEDPNKAKFIGFDKIAWDLAIIDEAHFGSNTDSSKQVLDALNPRCRLFLSGTPFKMLLSTDNRFTQDNTYTWSYIDEQRARTAEIVQYGEPKAAKRYPTGYYWLSPMKLYTIKLSSDDVCKDAHLFTDEEGFTFAKIFGTEHGEFKNAVAVAQFLNFISTGNMPYGKQAHTAYDSEFRHTFWFLPGVDACKQLKKRLQLHPIFKQYEIIVAADDNENEGDNSALLVQQKIGWVEEGLIDKIGTITLSCGKLTHGVSIPEWDAVFMLSDMESSQQYFQTIFRCQTPRPNGKRFCYVFDFAPNRVLTQIDALANKSKTEDHKEVIRELLEVFNVICYDGSTFNPVKIENFLDLLHSARSPRNLFKGLDFDISDITDEIKDELSQLECSSVSPDRSGTETTVNESEDVSDDAKSFNQTPVGGNDGSPANGKDKPKLPKKLTMEELLEKAKEALSRLVLVLFLTDCKSFDELLDALDKINCKEITGISAKSFRRHLESKAPTNDLRNKYTDRILFFRQDEEKEQDELEDELSS
jgi:superfamily II DNA or RNA helicase